MKKRIEKYILSLFNKAIHENKGMIAYNLEKEISHTLFSHIGIDNLKKMIEKAEQGGQNKYISLAELYSSHMRYNLRNELNDIEHKYFELLEPIGEFIRKTKKND